MASYQRMQTAVRKANARRLLWDMAYAARMVDAARKRYGVQNGGHVAAVYVEGLFEGTGSLTRQAAIATAFGL